MTSLGAVPGDASVNYNLEQSPASNSPLKYDIEVYDKLVCVTSYLREVGKSTRDCAAHPYVLDSAKEFKGEINICLSFDKKIVKDEKTGEETAKMDVGRCGDA